MSDLTEFLLARIAADESSAHDDVEALGEWAEGSADLDAAALLWQARRTGEGMSYLDGAHTAVAAERERIKRILATVYADHPDYREEWKL